MGPDTMAASGDRIQFGQRQAAHHVNLRRAVVGREFQLGMDAPEEVVRAMGVTGPVGMRTAGAAGAVTAAPAPRSSLRGDGSGRGRCHPQSHGCC